MGSNSASENTSKAADLDLRFEIHASIVFQLGEDLISDVVQALVELIKNAYDADSEWANVKIDTTSKYDKRSFFPDAIGYISIEDDGSGMDLDTIKRGWLTISDSLKREMKRKGQKTPKKNRTPMGDKGLGHLGVQRLGNNIEIRTKLDGTTTEYRVGWSWDDFRSGKTLSAVDLKVEKIENSKRKGTELIISELRDPSYWTEKDTFDDFQHKLSQLITPYTEFKDFDITASVDGKAVELTDLSERIRKLAHLRYRVDFDEKDLKINGKIKLDYLKPKDAKSAISPAEYEELIERDNGGQFFTFLHSLKKANAIGLQEVSSKDCFAEFNRSIPFDSIPGLKLIASFERQAKGENGSALADSLDPTEVTKFLPASPGPFHAEIDGYDLSHQRTDEKKAFTSTNAYKKYIKVLSGVRVFRDGFGIRVDNDWLGLGKQWTSGGSYYGLKPDNTMGFVALSAERNPQLVETTDREGFKTTPHYENFLSLFEWFGNFAHDAQEFVRRNLTKYVQEHQKAVAGVAAQATPQDVQSQVDAGLSKISGMEKPIEEMRSTIEDTKNSSTEMLAQIEAKLDDSKQAKILHSVAAQLKERLDQADGVLGKLQSAVQEAGRLKELNLIIQGQLKAVDERLEQTYEMVSLGLTAEALSHEIRGVADTMSERTKEVVRYMSRKDILDAKLLTYIEYMKSGISALRKQMAHLAPSLKYVRERKDDIKLTTFLNSLAEYFQSRWEGMPLQVKIQESGDPLTIRMNAGKLTQIFDNLFLNSEYWLLEDIRAGRLKSGVVTCDVDAPKVRVADNGRGIDPSIDSVLFDPFVTMKPKNQGRGLGLFVVHELLDSEDCKISVTPRRNSYGRHSQFELDFSGAIDAGK